MRRRLAWAWWGLLLVGACGRDDRAPLLVLAASSLTESFAELERDFEAEHPGVDVVVSTAGSQALRLQIEQGAPADVFASANAAHMQALVRAGLVRDDEGLARGALVVVVPTANPAGIASLGDLVDARHVVLGTTEVPVGIYARAMLDRAERIHGDDFRERVEARVVSHETNVRLVLAKVELGEADAAIVYRSDAATARGVTVIPIPPPVDVPAEYRIGALAAAPRPALAHAFVAHAVSPAGQAVLSRHGLTPRDE